MYNDGTYILNRNYHSLTEKCHCNAFVVTRFQLSLTKTKSILHSNVG